MEPFIAHKTDETPEINFDPSQNVFKIEGKSLPENVNTIYEPALDWLKGYVDNPNDKTVLDMNLSYFNTASSKMISYVLNEFEAVAKKGKEVVVRWHYYEEDEDLLETGEDYEEILDLTFEYVPYD